MIARRRKRPRVRSASFRTLFWLIRVEGCERVEAGDGAFDARTFSRLRFLSLTTRQRDAMARDVLKRYPERRFYP